MHSTPLLALAFVVPLLGLFAAEAHAGDASAYAGTWTFDETSDDRAAAEAVEELASEYPFLFRGLVKSKLLAAIKIAATITMDPGPNSMTITSEFSKWTSDLSATEVSVVNPEGDTITLKRWLEGDELHAVGAKGGSAQGFVFKLAPDGRSMSLEVTTSSPRLQRPLRYSLSYRKSP